MSLEKYAEYMLLMFVTAKAKNNLNSLSYKLTLESIF